MARKIKLVFFLNLTEYSQQCVPFFFFAYQFVPCVPYFIAFGPFATSDSRITVFLWPGYGHCCGDGMCQPCTVGSFLVVFTSDPRITDLLVSYRIQGWAPELGTEPFFFLSARETWEKTGQM